MPLTLHDLVRPGSRVAVADGASCPRELLADLSALAADVGGVELLLGWCPAPLDGLEVAAFTSVRTLMGGYALRGEIDADRVRYVAAAFGSVPALLHGPLRPDVVVAGVRRTPGGHRFLMEPAWVRAAVDAGAMVAAIERPAVPSLDRGTPLPPERVVVIGSSDAPADEITWGAAREVHRRIAEHVTALVPEGARVQVGPGPVGSAVLDALRVPVRVDTGIITDAVVDLDRRGLLLGRPLAPYVAGTGRLYEWADGRVDADRIEHTHDPRRLSSPPPLVAVNTALEVDLDGQVNVESIDGSVVAGIGGHPDYAGAAARSRHGLSVVAVPTRRGDHPTLVDRLSAPVSTPSHDIDVVVTELGHADLRGLDRLERRRAIATAWGC